MMAHWQYLKFVLLHKLYVYQEGRKLGVGIWQLLVHDLSKFSRAEWGPYVDYFYGGPWPAYHHGDARNIWVDKYTKPWVDRRFDEAWLHHQHANPHHWQYWVLREDSGEIKVLDMPDKYIREMVADWAGAGRAITGKLEVGEWYSKNNRVMLMSDCTRATVETLLRTHYGWNPD